MSKGAKITVAGAGALGLTTALALADAGAQVTLFDPAPVADNASGVAAGMLAPAFEAVLDANTAPQFDLLSAARDLWPALEARIGVRVDRSGAVAVGEADYLGRTEAGLKALGLHPTELERRALDGLAPGLAPRWTHGFLVREDWRIEAAQTLVALRRAAESAGVVFRQEAATGFEDGEACRGGEIVTGGHGVAAAVEGGTGRRHRIAFQIGLPALVLQRVISPLLGSALSATLWAVSMPATGSPLGSSSPTCASTDAWSQ